MVVINSAGKSQGCKGSPKEVLYNSTSCSTSLEITSSTTLSVQARGDTGIPNRPKIRRTLGEHGEADSTRRVDVCGVVQKVTTETIEAKDGKDARDYTIVEIIDDTGTGAHLTLWPPVDKKCGSDVQGKFLVAYNLQLAVSEGGNKKL